jgi:uncharacterized protein
MRRFMLAAILALFATPAWAASHSDADYVASQTVTEAVFLGALSALKPVISSAMENNLRKQGIEVSDPGAFADIVFQEFLGSFVEQMRIETARYYKQNFSPADLADIAEFYASAPGQELLRQVPAMTEFGAVMGAAVGQAVGVTVGARIADRLEEEGITLTSEPSMMQRLIDALR